MADASSPTVLGDYVNLQRGNTYKSSLLGQTGPILLGLASIARNGGFRPDNLKSYGGKSDPRMLLEPGDIYVSLKDVTQSADLLGAVSRVPSTIRQGRLTQDTVKLIFKSSSAPRDYLYWLLRTPQYREFCRAHATGTTNLGLPRDDFLSFPVPPVTAERLEIVRVLQALDDKVDLNRRMNKTLEAMAIATFDSAQISGEWAERSIDSVAQVFDGPHATPKLSYSGPIFLGISNLASGLLDLADTNHVSEEDFVKWTKRIEPRAGDVVFSYETRIGQAALIPAGLKCCLGRRMGLLRIHAEEISPILLLRAYLGGKFQELLRQRTIHGSTVDRIPLREMGTFPIALPQAEDAGAITSLLVGLRQKVEANLQETRTLSDIRDLLLSKLVSGEIRLKDTEKFTEMAA